MKRLSIALSIALALAAVAALQAQTQAPPAAQGDQVTVTGCLERAVRDVAVGTSGTNGAPRSDTKWVLMPPGVRADAETPGTTGRAPKISYRLDVADESNLVAHEGHKVEIKGRLEEGRPEQAGQQETKRSSHEQAPKLKLESIKMISANCSR